MLHRRGQGVVVSVGETRVALGAGVAEKLLVEPLGVRDMDGDGPIRQD
jgi:Fe2+ transport system protein FeoA